MQMAQDNGWEERLRKERDKMAECVVRHSTHRLSPRFPSDLSRALAEIEALRREGKALVDALDACEPHISSAFFMAWTRMGDAYKGPRYDKELAAFRARLEQKDQTNDR